jgi:potassium channel subfamily K protein 1
MGRIICIIYAIVGVPMTLLLLSIIVRKLLILLNNTYLWFRRKFSSDRRSESKIRFIHLLLVLIFTIIFLFIIPSIIFLYLEENWSFIDAFYFCFISLTTIGLGDLVAGDSPTQRNRLFYKICLTSKKKKIFFKGKFILLFSLSFDWCNNYDVTCCNGLSNA